MHIRAVSQEYHRLLGYLRYGPIFISLTIYFKLQIVEYTCIIFYIKNF